MRFALLTVAALLVVAVAANKSVPIKGQYLVTFKDHVTADQIAQFKATFASSHSIIHEYEHSVRGFAARASIENYLQVMVMHPHVKLIEQDYMVTISAGTCDIETEATWGLNRVSEKKLNLNGKYQYDADGFGVDAYIIDTGIYTENEDFQGRASFGATFTDDGPHDLNGHGTHVAGTVGGHKYGVAKNVTLIAVKVLDEEGSGSYAGIIKGIDWTIASHQKRKRPSVANMSLGGPLNAIINEAVAKLVSSGVVTAVAAGNEDSDACETSPASVETVISVGATDKKDVRSVFSNWGTCVDILAPGTAITSTWIGKPTATHTISGTSMASPHVCGAAALYLTNAPKATTPAEVKSHLLSAASKGLINLNCNQVHHWIATCSKTANKLLYRSCA